MTVAEPEQPGFADAYRIAQRNVASSVHLITTQHRGMPAGMTATAVCSLSFDPHSMLICVNKSASIFDTIERAGSFAINVLSEEDGDIATMFGSTKLTPLRFQSGSWSKLNGNPILQSAVANIACRTISTMDVGTHRVFAANVVAVRTRENCRPLLYKAGEYCSAETLPPLARLMAA
ncbi:flavin reductase family protein [Parasphingopyxis algicola]|uniref:flavin reductase family protein n=1 Tax=Parasphingopyxis algicola TaxID=2026624 RepID=UPI0015A37CF2|nr:flavin reductase family protein [Parasphingopyxis algicola]QLC26503.1 flavin reductase family protein [Parasphingopyxis algicola]